MRAALVLMAALACCTPALAQKNPPSGSPPSAPASPAAPAETAAPETSVAVGLATTCLRFARGDADAVAQAEGEGWTVDSYGTSGSHLASMSGSRNISGVGDVNMYGSFETYYGFTLRFCRADIILNADAPSIGVGTLTGWEGLEGSADETDAGDYGSWSKAEEDPDRLLLVIAQQDSSAIVQVTMITSEGND